MNAASPRVLRVWGLGTAAAILVAIAAGPFFTGMLPLPSRTLFWASLIALNALKWLAWYLLLPPRLPARWQWALPVAGAVLLNASLPFEVAFAYRAIGIDRAPEPLVVYLIALLISGLVSAIIWAAASGADARTPAKGAEAPGTHAEARAEAREPPRGLAARVPLGQLVAVTAEDHYIRLHLANGEAPLLLYRFADAVADLAGVDGLQVHRGAWVAAAAVEGARREGRRWWLEVGNGVSLPVSERHLPAVRARGWLGRRQVPAGGDGPGGSRP